MNPAVKYTFIILCFSMCLIKNIRKLRLTSVRCLLAGLFFTVLADYFLVFTYNFIPGILLFCMVQFCYCRIFGYSLLFLAENGLLGATLVWIASLILHFPLDVTAILAFFYFFCLATNVFLAWLRSGAWLSLGLTLMLLCDIHVGLSALPAYLSISPGTPLALWCKIAPIVIWVLYVPSQLIMALQSDFMNIVHSVSIHAGAGEGSR